MANQEFTAKELANEAWVLVPGWPEYEVSDLGRVRSTTGRNRWPAQHVLSPARNHKGYLCVCLARDGRYKSQRVHSLVALAFIGPRPSGYQVNHLDGKKSNNRPENLEYCTNAENIEHATLHGLRASGDNNAARLYPERLARGEKNPRSKLTDEKVRQIFAAAMGGANVRDLAVEYDVGAKAIYKIKRRQTWRHVTDSMM